MEDAWKMHGECMEGAWRMHGRCMEGSLRLFMKVVSLTETLRLFLNRAACHLKMRNCFKCLDDCTKVAMAHNNVLPQC